MRRATGRGPSSELLEQYRAAMSEFAGVPYRARKRNPRDDGWRKIVVISDLHVPYHDKGLISRLLGVKDADLLIIGGDFFDHWAFSKWPKTRRETTVSVEWEEGSILLKALAEVFPRTVIFHGNHDWRWMKDLSSSPHGVEHLELLRLMHHEKVTPLEVLVGDTANCEMAAGSKLENADFTFLHQEGDLVIGHAEIYSKISGKAASNLNDWARDFAVPEGVLQPYKVIGNGHTHQYNKAKEKGGVYALELGCACEYSPYVGGPKIQTPRPWARGFHTFFQKDGVTDMNQYQYFDLSEAA